MEVSKVLAENHELSCRWRRAEADKLMDLGDPEPPYLPTNSVLRKAKQERQDINLGANNETNSIQNILKMKYELHGGTIYSISLDPFFVHYWTLEQIAIYMQYPNYISIDATGSLVKKLKLPNGELSSHIYNTCTKLYVKLQPQRCQCFRC